MKQVRIKDIMNVNRGASPRPINDLAYFSNDGFYGWVRISDVTKSAKYLYNTDERLSDLGASFSVKLMKPTLFLSIAGSVGKACINKVPVCIHDGFVYFSKINNYNINYLYWFFSNQIIYDGLGKKGVFLNLNIDTIKNILIPKINLNQQIKIANFLDENCSRIDTEISLLEKKSKLLEEYKQSLIFETVTKGLDKNAKMKDSGVEWIGEIPKDKSLIRIKDILKQGIKSNIPASEKEEDGNYDFYLSGSKVKKSNHYITDKEVLLLPDGGSFYVHYNKEKNKCAYSNHVIPYINKNNFNLKYIYYFLISNKEVLNEILFNGIGLKNLDRKSFLNTFIIAFNKKEQENIVVFLDIETKKIEKQIELINKKIELLKEYKQSLIHEAVTGQLEI